MLKWLRNEDGSLGVGWGNIGMCWQALGTPVTTWILATGFWADTGAWDDSAVWID